MRKISLDIQSGSALPFGQAASKPRVNERHRFDSRYFCALQMKGCRVGGSDTTPVRGKLPAVLVDGLEPPGSPLKLTTLKTTRPTMQAALRQQSVSADLCTVVSITPYLSHATAKKLIAEAMQNKQGPGESLEASIVMLPDLFFCILDLTLQNFDYHHNKQAPAAIACRMLAGSVVHYSEKLQELEQ